MANGPAKAFETGRRLVDVYRSTRIRPMMDEKRELYHPKQVKAGDLNRDIADWETSLASYVMAHEDNIEMPED